MERHEKSKASIFFLSCQEQLLIRSFLSLQWKYQINIDGTVAAYRLPYLLAGDALVLKQESPYYEHFYRDLQPWVHYVPFKRDLSDLEEKIKWAMANDEKVPTSHRQSQ